MARALHLSKSVNGTRLNPNGDSQRGKSKDEEGIDSLVANGVGIVEERAGRSTRDAKGSEPAMQPRKRDLSTSKHFAGSKRWNAEQETGRDGKPLRQWGEGGELGPLATDDGKGYALERFLSATRKVDELIDRGRKLKLDPGSERRRTERYLKGPHHCGTGGGIGQSDKGPGLRDVSAARRRCARAVAT